MSDQQPVPNAQNETEPLSPSPAIPKPASQKHRGAPFGNSNARLHASFNPTIDPPCSEPEERKHRGAPVGNNNALVHGFYSSRLPARHVQGLRGVNPDSLKNEIELMRIFTRLVAEYGAGATDLESARIILLTLSHAATTINRLVRTQAFIPEEKLNRQYELEKSLAMVKGEFPDLSEGLDRLFTSDNMDLLFSEEI